MWGVGRNRTLETDGTNGKLTESRGPKPHCSRRYFPYITTIISPIFCMGLYSFSLSKPAAVNATDQVSYTTKTSFLLVLVGYKSKITMSAGFPSVASFLGLYMLSSPGAFMLSSSSVRVPDLTSSYMCYLLSHVQLFVTSMDCSPPGSSVHGILQARILE